MVDLLKLHPWAWPAIMAALSMGAGGFRVGIEHQSSYRRHPKHGVAPNWQKARLEFDYPPPNAILELAAIAEDT